MNIDARGLDFAALNERIRSTDGDCRITGCLGHRFIASGLGGRSIEIDGIPGNALGAYLSGASITVYGNAQDAVGDTMNDGRIVIHGNVGDAVGYAMRGGSIYIRGNAGYRAGIHMKAYEEKKPLMMIGGCAGSFLGEYQAGGVIVVLGLFRQERPIVGNFPCTGMHGGKIFIRGELNAVLPPQVKCEKAVSGDLNTIKGYLEEYASEFGLDADKLLRDEYYVLSPDSTNPYKRLYTCN